MSLIRFYEFISNIRPQCVIRPTCKNIKVWLSFNNRIKGTNLLSIDAIRKYIQPLYCISLGYWLEYLMFYFTLDLWNETKQVRTRTSLFESGHGESFHMRYTAALLLQLKLILVWRLRMPMRRYKLNANRQMLI